MPGLTLPWNKTIEESGISNPFMEGVSNNRHSFLYEVRIEGPRSFKSRPFKLITRLLSKTTPVSYNNGLSYLTHFQAT